jgi:hypothetical protein
LESPPAYGRSEGDLEPVRHQELRITFRVDRAENEIVELDYEDYH